MHKYRIKLRTAFIIYYQNYFHITEITIAIKRIVRQKILTIFTHQNVNQFHFFTNPPSAQVANKLINVSNSILPLNTHLI